MSNASGLGQLEDDEEVSLANDDSNINSDSEDGNDSVKDEESEGNIDDDIVDFSLPLPLGSGILDDK
jgi:hypothetical protein